MIRFVTLIAMIGVSYGLAVTSAQAASKEGGGVFTTPQKPRKRVNVAPTRSTSYDGSYQVSAVRTLQVKKIACLETYNMVIRISNSQGSHQLPFGHTLRGRVRGATLSIASTPEPEGGHWRGGASLPPRHGVATSGYLKWTGDGLRCEYRLSIRRQ